MWYKGLCTKGDFTDVIKLKTLSKEVIQDYLGEPDVIKTVLRRGILESDILMVQTNGSQSVIPE